MRTESPAPALAVAALLALAAAASADPGWRAAAPGFSWEFPRDHHAHPGFKTEWWYVTGHLETSAPAPRRFGYQITFFRIGLAPTRPPGRSTWASADLVMGHAALTEIDGKRHHLAEVLHRATPLLGGFPPPGTGDLLAWCRPPPGTPGRWTFSRAGEGFAFAAGDAHEGFALDLTLRPEKPRVFQGPNGYSRKGEGRDAASMYYSYTRLGTAGTVRLGDATYPVTGSSWLDREFASNSLGEHQRGWDWFALQLEDGRDLMLYVLRDAAGKVDHARGTVVSPAGAATWLTAADFGIEVLGRWTSPGTGATYPARWRLRVPGHGLDLEVLPLLADQENRPRRLPDLHYWEGAVDVRAPGGEPAGRGYVELTGYGESRRPGL